MTAGRTGTIEREKAEIGLFVTLEEPSREMELEATTAGFYTSPIDGRDYPRIQILTICELPEEHKKPMLPLLILPTTSRPSASPRRRPPSNSRCSVDDIPIQCQH